MNPCTTYDSDELRKEDSEIRAAEMAGIVRESRGRSKLHTQGSLEVCVGTSYRVLG